MTTRNIKPIEPAALLDITKSPGAAYLVIDHQQILTETYAGATDLATGSLVDQRTTFNAFSVTKTVTAAAALKLCEQNKILLSDPINPTLDEFHFRYPFTLQHLISHQAGFADPIPISWIHLADEDADFDFKKFIAQTIDRHSRLMNRPGAKFRYSSVGYLMLSQIIEKISGMPYDQYVLQFVMPVLSDPERLSYSIEDKGHHAVGYHPRYAISNLLLSIYLDKKKFVVGYQGKWMSFKNFYVNGKAYGGLIGNVRGLGRYLQSYLKNTLFSHQEMEQRMFTVQNGSMCLGWFSGILNEERYFCHAGGGGGYYCEIPIYPEIQLATAMMRNKSSFSDIRILDQIDRKTIFQNQK